MSNEKIANPFHVVTIEHGNTSIYDAHDHEVLSVWASAYWNSDALARELRDVMNENHKRLCHAANGDGETSNENTKEDK